MMNDLLPVLFFLFVFIFCSPFYLFICAKLVMMGVLIGRHRFELLRGKGKFDG